MTLSIGTAGGTRAVTGLDIGTAGGNRAVTEGWVGTASGNQQFFSSGGSPDPEPDPIVATASPGTLVWNVIAPGSSYVSDGETTLSISGGTAPYDIVWVVVDGSPGLDSPLSPHAETTGFASGNGYAGTTFRALVTDALGATGISNLVTVN